MIKEKLLIFPYGGNGWEALDCLGDDFELIGFVDDDTSKQGKDSLGFEIFDRSVLNRYQEAKILAVVGNPASFLKRKEIITELNISPERFATVIHPGACISEYAQIGKNCLIMAGVVITPHAIVENHCIILPNTVIHHNTQIGKYTCIGSNVVIAGHTQVGENCYIGSGTNIINNIIIGKNTMVGLGSNVIQSVAENEKVAGNPAKSILTN